MPPGEVHVWVGDLDELASDPGGERAWLSPDERERASRFRRELDRNRWVASRELLRRVLAGYTGRQPGQVELRLGTNDKPELVGGEDGNAPHFNLSHSGPKVVIAVAQEPVGVDIEQLRELPELDGLLRHTLRPAEIAAFEGVPEGRRAESFFAVWTRKEAYLKARGRGIGALKRVGVSVDPDSAALTGDDEDPHAEERYSVFDLDMGPGYRGAIAAAGDPLVVVRAPTELGDGGRD
ncbi:MAG: 4'-phosphopantetheinyl transferase superfamily protein [Gemmatimonadetes bacterium]|nr:4'-phosphopantetheinyl transferase superfamily protein [Gemmatimonadota bacterium]